MTTRYFVRRDDATGKVLELSRIHQGPTRMWGEFWQGGAWHETQRVTAYTLDPLAADELTKKSSGSRA